MSEFNKTSKLSIADLVSQPNSKNTSQDREVLKEVIRDIKNEQQITDSFETSQTIKEIKVGTNVQSNIFDLKEQSKQSDHNSDGTSAAQQIISRINQMQEKRNDQLQISDTLKIINNKTVDSNNNFVNPGIVDSFRDIESTDGFMEPKRNIAMSKVSESGEFEIESDCDKNLKSKMFNKSHCNQNNIFQHENSQSNVDDKEQSELMDMSSAPGKALDAKYDVKTSIKTNCTEMSRTTTIEQRNNNFDEVLTNKNTLILEKDQNVNVFNREFRKLMNKLGHIHDNVVRISKSTRYIDNSFSGCTNSIFYSWDSNEHKPWRLIEWRRLSSIYPTGTKFILKNEGLQYSDNVCSNDDLLAIMLSLQRYEALLINKLIHDFKPHNGKFGFRSMSTGQVTYLDDFVPV